VIGAAPQVPPTCANGAVGAVTELISRLPVPVLDKVTLETGLVVLIVWLPKLTGFGAMASTGSAPAMVTVITTTSSPGSKTNEASSSGPVRRWLLKLVHVFRLSPPYSPPHLLRYRHALRLKHRPAVRCGLPKARSAWPEAVRACFARSCILTVQVSTFPVPSVAKPPSPNTWRPLVTEGW